MANAGVGNLANDWLAQTFDPTPIFSFLVELVYAYTHTVFFYVIAALLLGLYFYSVFNIVNLVRSPTDSPSQSFVFITLFLFVHSALWRFGLSRVIGAQWSYIVEDGFAGQRLLGPVLQPSFFGVLLLTSILAFLRKRYFLAILLAVISANIHPTYLLSAGALVFAYCYVYFFEVSSDRFQVKIQKKGKVLLGMVLFSLVAVSPILYYTISNFVSTPPESTQAARHILVYFRIPHHALISNWFDFTSIVKIFLLLTGLFLARKTRLFLILLIPTIIGVVLTIVQIFSESDFLALLFPWRISIFLIPLSTALILNKVADWLVSIRINDTKIHQKYIVQICLFFLITITVVGTVRLILDFQRQANEPERDLYSFININKKDNEYYLIPIKMQNFRLATGSPAYVDFKAIPYQDADVLEWYRRIKLAENFYSDTSCSQLKQFLNTEVVSHIVVKQGELIDGCPFLHPIYQSPTYTLFQVITGR